MGQDVHGRSPSHFALRVLHATVSPRITYMMLKKTLREREKELQTLLGNPAGRKELQELESRYSRASGTSKPQRGSVITYILV